MTPVLTTHRPWYRRVVEDTLAHWRCRRTLQTLRGLDARTLADIGVDAGELSSIGAEAAGCAALTRLRIVRSLNRV